MDIKTQEDLSVQPCLHALIHQWEGWAEPQLRWGGTQRQVELPGGWVDCTLRFGDVSGVRGGSVWCLTIIVEGIRVLLLGPCTYLQIVITSLCYAVGMIDWKERKAEGSEGAVGGTKNGITTTETREESTGERNGRRCTSGSGSGERAARRLRCELSARLDAGAGLAGSPGTFN